MKAGVFKPKRKTATPREEVDKFKFRTLVIFQPQLSPVHGYEVTYFLVTHADLRPAHVLVVSILRRICWNSPHPYPLSPALFLSE